MVDSDRLSRCLQEQSSYELVPTDRPDHWEIHNLISNKTYSLSVENGTIVCSCPDYIYRGQGTQMFCKHLLYLMLQSDLPEHIEAVLHIVFPQEMKELSVFRRK